MIDRDLRFRPDRPRQPELLRQLGERQPSFRDMDIFEQQEKCKNTPQVTSELNDLLDWLVNHVPKTIKDKASRAYKTFKDKVMRLYNRVKNKNTGNEKETRINLIEDQTFKPYQPRGKVIEPPMKHPSNQKQIKLIKKKLSKLNKKIRHSKRKHNSLISKPNSIKKKIKELKGPREPEPIEVEQAFNGAYRSYRINGRSRMDVDTFFDQIRQYLIGLINRGLTDLVSARVQTTAWIRFIQAVEDDFRDIIGYNRADLAFNSRIMEIHQDSD